MSSESKPKGGRMTDNKFSDEKGSVREMLEFGDPEIRRRFWRNVKLENDRFSKMETWAASGFVSVPGVNVGD